jgi:MraZ protein
MAATSDQIGDFAEPPHSITQAKVDDKGRVKLPAESLEWCKNSNILKVFITTLDERSVRVYPIPVWKSTLNMLEAPGEHAEEGAAMAFLAKVYGGDADIDAQGRVLLPAALRSLLSLESQPVWVEHLANRIELTTKPVYDELLAAARANLPAKVALFKKLGV